MAASCGLAHRDRYNVVTYFPWLFPHRQYDNGATQNATVSISPNGVVLTVRGMPPGWPLGQRRRGISPIHPAAGCASGRRHEGRGDVVRVGERPLHDSLRGGLRPARPRVECHALGASPSAILQTQLVFVLVQVQLPQLAATGTGRKLSSRCEST